MPSAHPKHPHVPKESQSKAAPVKDKGKGKRRKAKGKRPSLKEEKGRRKAESKMVNRKEKTANGLKKTGTTMMTGKWKERKPTLVVGGPHERRERDENLLQINF